MLGRALLKIRQNRWHRPDVLFARDFLRPKILRTPPIAGATADEAEIHVLTSEKDWLNLIWSLKSFYAHVPRRYRLVIHGDPSLSPQAADALSAHFPDARLIGHGEAREEMLDTLAGYPRCRRLRQTNTLSIKCFDFVHFLSGDRMILFDSDLLFFRRPEAFLARLDASAPPMNAFNRDISTAYAVDMDTIRSFGHAIVPEVNSGFGIVYRGSMPLDLLEEFLGIPGLPDGHFWRIEQTLFALCASRFGVALLPDDYRVFLDGDVGERPYRHYVGAVRDKMYAEGMRKLSRTLLVAGREA
jgi:hypothetical protein